MKEVSGKLAVGVIALTVAMSFVDTTFAFSTVRPSVIHHKTSVATLPLSFSRPLSYTCLSVERHMTSSSEEEESSIQSPLDRPLLGALDFMAILLFAFVGTSSHNSASDYLAVLAVAVPFLISWFVTTPFLGLYKSDATSDKIGAFKTAAKGWIVAIPLGCVLRGLIKGYVPPLPFVIVTMIATIVVIGGTRVAYTAISEKAKSS